MDRRTSIKWVLAASAAWPLLKSGGSRAAPGPSAQGYGTDPDLLKAYRPGELWPLTFTEPQRGLARILADLIIPADEHSPSASGVGVVEFIDEWVSAPYPAQRSDRTILLEGFAWLDADSARRFNRGFADLSPTEHHTICDAICDESRAANELRAGARFFAAYRDLTAGGFYSTPVGRKDLNFIGNVPLARFDGPPRALLNSLGLP